MHVYMVLWFIDERMHGLWMVASLFTSAEWRRWIHVLLICPGEVACRAKKIGRLGQLSMLSLYVWES